MGFHKNRLAGLMLMLAICFSTTWTSPVFATDWTVATNSQDKFLEFFRWVRDNKSKTEKSTITFYMMIETMDGKSTPVPAPLQTKDQDDRVAELVVTFNRSAISGKLGSALTNAYSAVDIPDNTRSVDDFQTARAQMESASHNMGNLKSGLTSLRDGTLKNEIQSLYDEYEQAIVTAIQVVDQAQAKKLKGKLKKEDFVYYENIKFGSLDHPMLVIGTKKAEFEKYNEGSVVKGTIVSKGTEKLSRNKYFKYKGKVSKKDMFAALARTGWNMKNLKKADDLVKE